MLRVKIKTKGRRLYIPVPYALMHLFIGVLTSKRLLALANRAIKKEGKKNFEIPNINKKDLKTLLRELSGHKGLLLFDAVLKDGTEVSIRL